MTCPKCGSEIDGDSVFCSNCGEKIGGTDGAQGKQSEGGVCPFRCLSKIKLPTGVSKFLVILFYFLSAVIAVLVAAGIFGIGRPKYKSACFEARDGYCDYCGKTLAVSDMLCQTTKRGDEFCQEHRGLNRFQAGASTVAPVK